MNYLEMCSSNCSGNGICFHGSCFCKNGFTGPSCNLSLCLETCPKNSFCNKNATCECIQGYYGQNCDDKHILHGKKLANNTIICKKGWTGDLCDTKLCANNCSDHGLCHNGTCLCSSGWTGFSCQVFSCPNECSYNGYCSPQGCLCKQGWKGSDCSIRNITNGQILEDGTIVCEEGYSGPTCDDLQCSIPCKNNGKCVENSCVCQTGWTGDLCEVRQCRDSCNYHGVCVNGTCLCEDGWKGDPLCSKRFPIFKNDTYHIRSI